MLKPTPVHQSGVSLVELMIGSAVGLIVIAAVLATYAVIARSGSETMASAKLNAELRAAMDMMVRDIRRAGSWTATLASRKEGANPFTQRTGPLITDVNIFDGVGVGDVGLRDRFFKWIKIDSDEINVIPAEGEEFVVIGFGWAREQAAVNGGVQSFDTSAKKLGRFCVISNFGDVDIVVAQKFGGAARGEQIPAESGESFGEVKKASFVVNGENGSGHLSSFNECVQRIAAQNG